MIQLSFLSYSKYPQKYLKFGINKKIIFNELNKNNYLKKFYLSNILLEINFGNYLLFKDLFICVISRKLAKYML